MNIFSTFSLGFKTLVVGAALGFASLFGYQAPVANVGVAIPAVIANFQTTLAQGIGSTDTSMTLVNGTDALGANLTGYMCFTVDANTSNSEFICGTASSTSVTVLVRGISPTNPNATSSTLALTHRRGASVVVTNYPQLGFITRIINGQDTFPNVIQYDTSVTNSAIAANNYNLVDYGTLASTSFSGTVDASTTQKGIVELSTRPEFSSGAASGNTTASLLPPNSYFNATSTATTTGVVTGVNGKISATFIATTSDYAWTGSSTFSGTALFNGSTTFTSTTTGKNIPFFYASTSAATTTVASAVYLNLSTTTFTMTYPQRVFVSVAGSAFNFVAGNQCIETISIDNVNVDNGVDLVTNVSSAINAPENMAISWLSDPLPAGSHTFDIRGRANGSNVPCIFNIYRISYLGL